MSDKRRTQVVAIALAVTLIGSVFVGGGVIAAQTDDGNETDGNETVAANETAGMNETENETTGLNETGNETTGLNETGNETGLNETGNETGLNETGNETGLNETGNETGLNETENETAAGNETAAANETAADNETAYLRIAHFSPDVDQVDVMVDNETVVSDVGYDNVSEYQIVEPGEHEVTINSSDDETVLYQDEIETEAGTATTLAASTEEAPEDPNQSYGEDQLAVEVVTFEDEAPEPNDSQASVRVVHLSPDASNIDVTLEDDDTVLADNLTYHDDADYVNLTGDDYTVEVRMEGDNEGSNVLETFDVTVQNGTVYSAFVHGYDITPPLPGLDLTLANDTLPTADGEANETAGMNETENETTAMNETGNETAAMNETGNETAGLNETGNETGLNETENETLGEENETLGEENETLGEENETGAEANESANESARVAP